MLDDTALWRELKSFKGDWDRWSLEERLAVTVTAFASVLSASIMSMNSLYASRRNARPLTSSNSIAILDGDDDVP